MEKSGKFSVKSVYKHLCSSSYDPNNKKVWKPSSAFKNKILYVPNVTKDNLVKKKWKGDDSCAFFSLSALLSNMIGVLGL